MTLTLRNAGLALGFAALTLVSGIAISPTPAQAAVVVAIGPRHAPPALRHEVRPIRPHRGWAWQQGYWAWRNSDYVWVPGVWAAPPRARAAWVSGHWAHRHHSWVWVEGHWR